jgi:hypothetical protein
MLLRAPRIDVTTGAFTCRFSRVPNVLQPESGTGKSTWRIRRSEPGWPFYCVILDGSCHLAIDRHEAITLQESD